MSEAKRNHTDEELDEAATEVAEGKVSTGNKMMTDADAKTFNDKLGEKTGKTYSAIGHNSGDPDGCKDVGGVAGKRLKAFIERIETLEEEKSNCAEDIRDIYTEAKSTGFDVKTMRKLIKIRAMDTEKRAEEDQLLALYKSALGLL